MVKNCPYSTLHLQNSLYYIYSNKKFDASLSIYIGSRTLSDVQSKNYQTCCVAPTCMYYVQVISSTQPAHAGFGSGRFAHVPQCSQYFSARY